jgi:uncharacterized protein YecT (DUF1311 family)
MIGYGPQEAVDRGQLKAILLIEGPISCASPTFVPSNGALVEIKLRPLPYKNSERLELVIFAPTTLEEIKASYTYQLIPTPAGQKQMIKHPPRPKEVGGWWFIREEYNPCDESTDKGAWICSVINHKKADETLNTEWTRLLGVVAPATKHELISTQNKWRKACSAKCVKKISDAGTHSWGLAYETSCLAEEKAIRSQKFRELYECIQSGKLDCPKLENKP